ncbi:hypothetical protein [Erythrobacter sp.]|uniref:hypothetical protein n=1 Tax=Erythrobacter sp. TaxID=1042 RepID=UPI003C779F09
MIKLALSVALLCGAAGAAAQDSTDFLPASEVQLPQVRFATDKRSVREGYKFFVFHHADLNYEEASRDFAECRAHIVRADPRSLPSFVAWADSEQRSLTSRPNPYGLVGDLLLSIVGPKMDRGLANSKMLMCMNPRGYDRYAVDQATYEALHEGDERMVIAMQAKLATGSTPSAEPLP